VFVAVFDFLGCIQSGSLSSSQSAQGSSVNAGNLGIIPDVATIVLAAANVVLLGLTFWYAIETKRLSKTNAVLVEREYVTALMKQYVKPLESVVRELIRQYSSLAFECTYLGKKSIEGLPLKVDSSTLLQNQNEHFLPNVMRLAPDELAGYDKFLGDIDYHGPFLERENRLRRKIHQYNEEANKTWRVLLELRATLIKSGLRASISKLMDSADTEDLSANSVPSDTQQVDLKRKALDQCLYLACSKLLMEKDAYDALLVKHWSDDSKMAAFGFWRKFQDDLLGGLPDDKRVSQLKTKGRKRGNSLVKKLKTAQQELTRVESSYMRNYYIRSKDVR
jgi:hypothetical protein